mmetsp:Transcript_39573/g.108983  ORF Transcript_39573/g.108983 Transcript_39573/m.108983 type:complete len:239 (+) Transcript_39573:84-800(+)
MTPKATLSMIHDATLHTRHSPAPAPRGYGQSTEHKPLSFASRCPALNTGSTLLDGAATEEAPALREWLFPNDAHLSIRTLRQPAGLARGLPRSRAPPLSNASPASRAARSQRTPPLVEEGSACRDRCFSARRRGGRRAAQRARARAPLPHPSAACHAPGRCAHDEQRTAWPRSPTCRPALATHSNPPASWVKCSAARRWCKGPAAPPCTGRTASPSPRSRVAACRPASGMFRARPNEG